MVSLHEEDAVRALLIVLALPLMWLAFPASAQASPSLAVTPTTVAAGGSVQVSGTCDPSTNGFAMSSAFLHDAAHDFAGVAAAPFTTDASGAFAVTASIPASTAPGTYSVTARCGGGNLGITATLTVTAAGAPTAVPAGSGGFASPTSDRVRLEQGLALALGIVLLSAGALGLARLHRP